MSTRTLVIHLGGIGDFLLALPAIQTWALDGPLSLLGYRDRLQLAVGGGIAEGAYSADTMDLASAYSTPSRRLLDFLSQFDRAVAWVRDDGPLRETLTQAGIDDIACHPGLPDARWTRHASEYYADCLGVKLSRHWCLNIAAGPDEHDIVIHPGSGGRKKNWPLDRFLRLAAALEDRGRQITWCLGPAEEDTPIPPGSNVLRVESLSGLAPHLAAARHYIGNDSGITHLSAALGRPTTALFGPTNPTIWAPRGSHVNVVSDSEWPTVRDVTSALIAATSPTD